MDNFEQNLFELYRTFSKYEKVSSKDNKRYSSVNIEGYQWPNYIFDIKPNNNIAIEKKLFNEINLRIDERILPSFMILDENRFNFGTDDYLFNLGIRKIDLWPIMYLPLENVSYEKSEGNIKHRIITSNENFGEWMKIVKDILYPKKKIDTDLFKYFLTSQKFDFIISYYNNIPVSTTMLYYFDNIAGLYQVATKKEFRNLGLGKEITKKSIIVAKQKGCQFMTLQSSRMALSLYERLGFIKAQDLSIYWKVGII